MMLKYDSSLIYTETTQKVLYDCMIAKALEFGTEYQLIKDKSLVISKSSIF